MRLPLCSLLALVLLTACGGNVVVEGAGGVTASSSSTGQGGSVTLPGSGGAPTTGTCLGAAPTAFPSYMKTCSSAADCTTQDIYDCCATYEVGVASSQLKAFSAYEAVCENDLPKCGCASPPVAEDGKMGMIQVACQGGECMTYVP
jgi:hypothetical protein